MQPGLAPPPPRATQIFLLDVCFYFLYVLVNQCLCLTMFCRESVADVVYSQTSLNLLLLNYYYTFSSAFLTWCSGRAGVGLWGCGGVWTHCTLGYWFVYQVVIFHATDMFFQWGTGAAPLENSLLLPPLNAPRPQMHHPPFWSSM